MMLFEKKNVEKKKEQRAKREGKHKTYSNTNESWQVEALEGLLYALATHPMHCRVHDLQCWLNFFFFFVNAHPPNKQTNKQHERINNQAH